MLRFPQFSPDGRTLAAIRYTPKASDSDPFPEADSIIEMWDIATLTMIAELEEGVGSFAFSPDGKFIAAVNRNKSPDVGKHTIHLWDVAARKRVAELGKG